MNKYLGRISDPTQVNKFMILQHTSVFHILQFHVHLMRFCYIDEISVNNGRMGTSCFEISQSKICYDLVTDIEQKNFESFTKIFNYTKLLLFSKCKFIRKVNTRPSVQPVFKRYVLFFLNMIQVCQIRLRSIKFSRQN